LSWEVVYVILGIFEILKILRIIYNSGAPSDDGAEAGKSTRSVAGREKLKVKIRSKKYEK